MKNLFFVALITIFSCNQSSHNADINYEDEKRKIFEVIENETNYYYQEDFENWSNCFLDTSYFRHYGYWEGFKTKVRYYNGFDTLAQIKKAQFKRGTTKWKGSSETRYNENIRIYNDVAWATYLEISHDNTTQEELGKAIETRILEKHKGDWKLVYMGFYFLPDSIQ